MEAAPSCTWVDCPAVLGWTMILHWQGTQPRLIDSKLNLINRNSIKTEELSEPTEAVTEPTSRHVVEGVPQWAVP